MGCEAGQVRITAHLIQVNDETHIWAKSYEPELRGILALRSELAGAIAGEIELKLTAERQARLAQPRRVDPC